MDILVILLLIAAAVCFVLVAFGVRTPGKINLVGLGLLCWVLTALLPKIITG